MQKLTNMPKYEEKMTWELLQFYGPFVTGCIIHYTNSFHRRFETMTKTHCHSGNHSDDHDCLVYPGTKHVTEVPFSLCAAYRKTRAYGH